MSTPAFVVDAASSAAPYEQLRLQVLDAVRDGALVAGAKLPTVRALAEELGLAVNTVARSYRELERDGVIETRGRAGSFVSAGGDTTRQQAQLAAAAFGDRMRQLGIGTPDAVALVRAALAASEG